MPTPTVTRDECQKAITAVKEALNKGYSRHGSPSAVAEAARKLGVNRKVIEHRLKRGASLYGLEMPVESSAKPPPVTQAAKLKAVQEPSEGPRLPDFPDDDIPVEKIIDIMCQRFEKRQEHARAKRWFRISMPTDEPFAILWWGDPHLDSNGCNWPLLQKHAKLAQAKNVYSVNIGDTLDNWPHGSRLLGLYAHSDQSVETAAKLARWFLTKAGIRWLVWLFGNHDAFPGHTGRDWIKEIGGKGIAFSDWGAKFVLACPNGAEFKVWASHNFPGNSQWNTLHGPQKAAHMKEQADLYVCGHTHNWALHKEESGSRDFVYSIVRTRGYKFLDDYAEKLGHFPQRYGASVITVFDPATQRHHSFEHPEDGLVYLEGLRRRKAA